MYAVISTGGKQYKVEEGDTLRVEKLPQEAGDKVTFDKVLYIGGDEAKVGNPTVSGATVDAEVIRVGRAKKILVGKFKPKTNYKRKNGHRQYFTVVKIDKINA